ncbi:TadE/TadG family type IV pilus assembly protein [Stratiformator vulcanicus]|uniref:TadE-like protein n=1 Tax=Stratiformator vulcanicus TaxID=2527980 RepID=A0A517R145_9PLAN|nr:TadE/TadG family type IV pilus assembly protein [Stratiformator vulcanicus]QDT37617.1 TadE-like protein [Stratiformator vulcanicus]
MIRFRTHQPKFPRRRRAAAAVEFAVILPVLVALLMGALEIGRGIWLQNTLQEIAQAGCRVHSIQSVPAAATENVISEAMTRAGITEYLVTYDPPAKSDFQQHMDPVTVIVTVPFAHVSYVTPSYLNNSSMSAQCTMPANLDD